MGASESLGYWTLPKPEINQKAWNRIPRVARTVPFGYKLNENDSYLLDPIPNELDKLEMARKYVNQYSYREVANWLSKQTDRYISHVGLRKRLDNEQHRKNKARSLRKWAEYAEKAITKAKEIEEARTGASQQKEATGSRT